MIRDERRLGIWEDGHKPTLAEYIARRELILDLSEYLIKRYGWYGHHGRMEFAVREVRQNSWYWSEGFLPPTRDKTPLPLP